jgi:hypothetical protein
MQTAPKRQRRLPSPASVSPQSARQEISAAADQMRRLREQIRDLLRSPRRGLGDRWRFRLGRELARNSAAAAEEGFLGKNCCIGHWKIISPKERNETDRRLTGHPPAQPKLWRERGLVTVSASRVGQRSELGSRDLTVFWNSSLVTCHSSLLRPSMEQAGPCDGGRIAEVRGRRTDVSICRPSAPLAEPEHLVTDAVALQS